MIGQNNRLYILVSDELEPVYGCVQGGHAVAQYLLEHPNSNWKNNTIVYLYCDIDLMKHKFDMLELDYSAFYEPDLDNKLTSIAILNPWSSLVKTLKLVA